MTALPQARIGRSDDFYARLDPVDAFDRVAELDAYAPVPDDWVVVIADVVGSTAAIAEGRYKQVNMVGAAVITAVLNAAGQRDLPFVFGGDGAMLVVPSAVCPEAVSALRRLQAFSGTAYGLRLRAATVPVSRLRAEGRDVCVMKLRLSDGNHLAMMSGGGAERAERILKTAEPGDPDLLTPDDRTAPDLDGLSCRWEPLVPRNGRMIALIVQPVGGAGLMLARTLTTLARILGNPIARHAPVSDASLRFRFPPTGLGLEVAALPGRRSAVWAWSLFTALMQALAERFGLKIGDYDQPRYRGELKTNTDFRKIEDGLRVVLDVTPAQAERIDAWLKDEYRAGRLVYGMHVADRALMTCLVFSLANSRHVHFVDAAAGGFSRAAAALKERIAALAAH